jgi:D-serine deaminase-like pyridoxal phosphate-dependent protein
MYEEIPTPTLLLDKDRLARNIERMQAVCDAHGVELWPHIKTHKMVEVARMQLAAGAKGLTCAKIGEAEAMLPSGVRSIFLAHSLVDPLQGPRLRALADQLDELIVACTSEGQAAALEDVLAAVDLSLPVMMAVDTGLGREGARGPEGAVRLADCIRRLPHLRLRGIYSHEGHAYGAASGASDACLGDVYDGLMTLRGRIDPSLSVWPGCSVTAARMATRPGVNGVRPGTYVFGDLGLTVRQQVMDWDDIAVTVLATVIDRPQPGLALLDAGSKTFSGDKTPEGKSGSLYDRRDIHVTRCSEEHGWTTGGQVDELRIGERVRAVPAHICPVINLADDVTVIREGKVVDTWRVAARGKVR